MTNLAKTVTASALALVSSGAAVAAPPGYITTVIPTMVITHTTVGCVSIAALRQVETATSAWERREAMEQGCGWFAKGDAVSLDGRSGQYIVSDSVAQTNGAYETDPVWFNASALRFTSYSRHHAYTIKSKPPSQDREQTPAQGVLLR